MMGLSSHGQLLSPGGRGKVGIGETTKFLEEQEPLTGFLLPWL